jgi:Ca2+-binding EF-hand superfamily protein
MSAQISKKAEKMTSASEEKVYNYTKFTQEELSVFTELLDVEKSGIINLADLEAASKSLGLESIYQNIRNLLKSKIDMEKGGIPVADFVKYLN